MSDPINNPPSYYLLPGGTEIREMIRQVRGDESTIEHLAQSIMEYASRLGKKPGASRADDFHKIARCAIQGANVCEGRSVSDNGAPPTEPDQHALATAIRQAIAILAPRTNCVTGVGCDIQAAVNVLTDAVGSESTPASAPPPEPRVHRAAVAMLAAMRGPHGPSWSPVPAGNAPNHGHSIPGVWDQSNDPDLAGKPCEWCAAWREFVAAVEGEPAPAPAPPPEPERPSITLPVVFGGDQIPANGVYLSQDSRGCLAVNYRTGGYAATSTWLGPIPPACEWPKPEGEREGEGA